MPLERIIGIKGLKVMAFIGVPEEERAVSQLLLFDIHFTAVNQPVKLYDELALTVDYYSLSRRAVEIAAERPRMLIETLADEVTAGLLKEFSLRWIELTIRKFILPETEWVSVTVRLESAPKN